MAIADWRAACRRELGDESSDWWTDNEIDQALRSALRRLSVVAGVREVQGLTLAAAGREVDISGLTYTPSGIAEAWWPWDAANPAFPAPVVLFDWWIREEVLYLRTATAPAVGDVVRVFYMRHHTLNGLDSATADTVSAADAELVALLAAARAAGIRASDTSGRINVSGYTPVHWAESARALEARAREELERVLARSVRDVTGPYSIELT